MNGILYLLDNAGEKILILTNENQQLQGAIAERDARIESLENEIKGLKSRKRTRTPAQG